MIYVTATDKCLSGWGKAEGKTCKRIWEFENSKTAYAFLDALKLISKREGYSYCKICYGKPKFRNCVVSESNWKECPVITKHMIM